MPTTIIFDEQIAGGVVDLRRTKSEVKIPIYYSKDLYGCLDQTHHVNKHAATFNSTGTLCSPPTVLQTRSLSTLNMNAATITAAGAGSGVAQAVLDTGAELAYGYVRDYLSQALVSAQDGINYQYDTRPDFMSSAAQRRGDVWVEEALAGAITYSVSVPRLTPVFDQCRAVVGVKGGASLSIVAKDANCVPRLVRQVSMKVALASTGIAGVAAPWTVATITPATVAQYEQQIVAVTAPGVNPVQAVMAPLPFSLTFTN